MSSHDSPQRTAERSESAETQGKTQQGGNATAQRLIEVSAKAFSERTADLLAGFREIIVEQGKKIESLETKIDDLTKLVGELSTGKGGRVQRGSDQESYPGKKAGSPAANVRSVLSNYIKNLGNAEERSKFIEDLFALAGAHGLPDVGYENTYMLRQVSGSGQSISPDTLREIIHQKGDHNLQESMRVSSKVGTWIFDQIKANKEAKNKIRELVGLEPEPETKAKAGGRKTAAGAAASTPAAGGRKTGAAKAVAPKPADEADDYFGAH